MNENEYLIGIIREQLEASSPLVLISIISLQGSTPRHSGTKMVVGANGKPYGTIGGSLIEAVAVREAKTVLSSGKSTIFSYELTGKDATAPGMICGGKAEILLEYLAPSEENREFASHWYEAMQQCKDFYLFTHLKGDKETLQVLGHAILFSDGCIVANNSLSGTDVQKLNPELHKISDTAVLQLGDTRVIVDLIRRLKTLYCFGAGHVAVPTAHLAALVGFRVVVVDDRPEYTNAERFPEVYKISIITEFNHAFEGLEIDADSFIVIVTRGHIYDRAVLEQALETKAGYIGMISSRKKRAVIYEALMAQGVKKERLEQVHSPIGIDIGGETPEEIAVSIIAELIKVRSEQST
jgi:xanthine dehydrogenase accessory factor